NAKTYISASTCRMDVRIGTAIREGQGGPTSVINAKKGARSIPLPISAVVLLKSRRKRKNGSRMLCSQSCSVDCRTNTLPKNCDKYCWPVLKQEFNSYVLMCRERRPSAHERLPGL